MIFELYRLTMPTKAQPNLIAGSAQRQEILRESFINLSHREDIVRGGWNLANISLKDFPDAEVFTFKAGAVRIRNRERLRGSETFPVTSEEFPNARCIYSFAQEVLAIERKQSLTSDTSTTAGKIESILRSMPEIFESNFELNITPMRDASLIAKEFASTQRVRAFWISYGRPNNFDASDFEIEQKKVLEEIGGKTLSIGVHGTQINKDFVANLASAAANAGNEITVELESDSGNRYRKKLSDAPGLQVDISPEDLKAIDSGGGTFEESVRSLKIENLALDNKVVE